MSYNLYNFCCNSHYDGHFNWRTHYFLHRITPSIPLIFLKLHTFASSLLAMSADVRLRVVNVTEDLHLSTVHTHTFTFHNRGLHMSQKYLTSTGSSSPPLTALRNVPISHLVRSGALHSTPVKAHNVEQAGNSMPAEGAEFTRSGG